MIIHGNQRYPNQPETVYIFDKIMENQELFDCSKNLGQMYSCKICGFKVYLVVNLIIHVEMAHRLKITFENFCSFSETNYNISKILKSYNCENCDFRTFSLLVYMKHTECKNPSPDKDGEWWRCRQCEFRTRFEGHFIQHKNRKHSIGEIQLCQCPKCPYKVKCKYQLMTHMQLKHAPFDDVPCYSCEHCSFTTEDVAILKKHAKTEHATEDTQWLFCELCLHKTKQKKYLQVHMLMKHTAPEDINWFKCGHCVYKAKDKSTLTGHVLAKHTASEDIQWFLCELCGHKTKRRSHLKSHMRRKHKIQDYE